jgi:heme-degrading monooxygenase HmoA
MIAIEPSAARSSRRTTLERKGDTAMIARVWRGWTKAEEADRYETHYRTDVAAELRQVSGFRGARLLRRTDGDETEFISLTFFDDFDAIHRFAGDDHDVAVVADHASAVLVRFDQRVRHYEIAFEV